MCDNLGVARKVPTDIAAKAAGNVGTGFRGGKACSKGFEAYGIRFNRCYRELGQTLKRLDKHTGRRQALPPREQRNPSALENSGLNGSEVGAVLATQENSYDYVRVLGGLGGPVAESSTVSARTATPRKSRTLRRWLAL